MIRPNIQELIDAGLHREHSETARDRLHQAGLIGSDWRHQRNRHVYKVVGFSFNGDLDEWCVEYKRAGSDIRYNRTLSNAFGFIDGVNLRFEEITDAVA